MSRSAEHKIARETRRLLVEHFPECFAPKGEPKRPLKIGIQRDIKAKLPDLPMRRIRLALRDYTGGALYLRGLMIFDTRYDLDGRPAGHVSTEAALLAGEHLSRLNAHNDRAKRKGEARVVEAA